MRIIGVDPGLENTGFAIAEIYDNICHKDLNEADLIRFSGSYIRLLKIGVIKNSPNSNLGGRLLKIFNEISRLIEEYPAEKLVLEKIYSHYLHPVTSISIGYARGVVVLAAQLSKVNIIDISATKAKKAVTGKGNASKHQVNRIIAYIFSHYNIPENYDITDAIALVLAQVSISKVKIDKLKVKH